MHQHRIVRNHDGSYAIVVGRSVRDCECDDCKAARQDAITRIWERTGAVPWMSSPGRGSTDPTEDNEPYDMDDGYRIYPYFD